MKSKNKILVGCLALLLALSVGYALFSETVTINGTATAKGDFEITATRLDMSLEENQSMYFSDYYGGDFENPTMSIVDNVISSNVILKAPGSYYTFGIAITNTGSIPAKLKSIKNLTTDEILLDKNTQGYNASYEVGEEGKNLIRAELYSEDGYLDDYEYKPEDGIRVSNGYPSVEMLDAVLDPGESMYFFIHYIWANDSTEAGESLNLSWDLKFDYEQVTAS